METAVGTYASTFSPGLKQDPETWHIQNIWDIVPAYEDQGISAHGERQLINTHTEMKQMQTDLTEVMKWLL